MKRPLHKCLLAVLLVCFGINFATAKVIEIELESISHCDNEIEIAVYLGASDFASQDFKIGSSSMFFKYDPATIEFISYEPLEFNPNTSNIASLANWKDQQLEIDYDYGLINLILHKEDGGYSNYDLTQAARHLVGKFIFKLTGNAISSEVNINQNFTYFNSELPNDGSEKVKIENYPSIDVCFADFDCIIPEISVAGLSAQNEALTLCEGDNLNLSVSVPANQQNLGGNLWRWTGPNGFVSNNQNLVINNITKAEEGTYSVSTLQEEGYKPPETGLLIWLDGKDINGDGTAVTAGDTALTWVDKSNSEVDGTLSTIAGTPLFLANGGINFTLDQMEGLDVYEGFMTETTVFIVAKENVATTGFLVNFNGPDLGNEDGPTPTDRVSLRAPYTSPTTGGRSWYWSPGDINDDRAPIYNDPTPVGATTLITATKSVSDGFNELFLNGREFESTKSITAEAAYTDGGLRIGRSITDHDYYEIIVYNRKFSEAEQQKIESYLAAKWNLTLPFDHPNIGIPTFFSELAEVNVSVSPNIDPIVFDNLNGKRISNEGAVCEGSSIVISADFSATQENPDGTDWAWTGPNGFTSDSRNLLIDNIDATKVGAYDLTITANESFNPNDLSPILWLDGKDITGDGSSYDAGTSVSNWVDKSTIGADGTVTAVSGSPKTLSGGGIKLTSDILDGDDIFDGSMRESTVIFVSKENVASQNYLINFNGNYVGNAADQAYNDRCSFRAPYYSTTDGNSYWYFGGGDLLDDKTVAVNAGLNTTDKIVFAATKSVSEGFNSLSINGGMLSNQSSAAEEAITGAGLRIGKNTPDHNLYEVIAFNRKLSSTEMELLEGYLAEKWQVGLESNHPFIAGVPSSTCGSSTASYNLSLVDDPLPLIYQDQDLSNAVVNGEACGNQVIALSAHFSATVEDPAGTEWEWFGPNNFNATTKDIQLANISDDMIGDYTVVATSYRPFDPNALLPVLWLDGLDLHADGSSIPPGSVITDWKDKSGNGANGSVSTLTGSPIALPGGGVNFNNNLDNMIGADVFGGVMEESTIFVVSKEKIESGNILVNFNGGAIGNGDDVNLDDRVTFRLPYVSPTTGDRVWYWNPGDIEDDRSSIVNIGPALQETVLVTATKSVSAGFNEIIINGGMNSNQSSEAEAAITSQGLRIGRAAMSHDIYEIMAFDYKLSPSDQAKVEGYLAAKWGTNLPNSHEYFAESPVSSGCAAGMAIYTLDREYCCQENFTNPVTGLNVQYDFAANTFTLAWDQYPNALACLIMGNKDSSPNDVPIFVGSLNNAANPSSKSFSMNFVQPNVVYRWKIICGCSMDPMVASTFSDTHYFEMMSSIP